MDLKPGQLSALAEMGIPVWELRQQKSTELDIVTDHAINSTEIEQQLLQSDWLILIDKKTYNDQAQRLLQAMLSTIDLSLQTVVIMTHEQLPQLHALATDRKVLLAFGATARQLMLDNKLTLEESRGKAQRVLNSKLTTIVSFGLDDLLERPENKALAWQDLQLARATYQQFGQA